MALKRRIVSSHGETKKHSYLPIDHRLDNNGSTMILTMKRPMVRATCVLPQSTPGTPNWILIIEYYGTKKKQLPNAFCSQKRSDNHHECGNQNWERSNKTLEIIPIRTQPKKEKKLIWNPI